MVIMAAAAMMFNEWMVSENNEGISACCETNNLKQSTVGKRRRGQ